MDTDHFPRVSVSDSDPCIDEILAWCEPYIRIYARKNVPRNICRSETIDLDIDEMVQKTLIKLWHMLLTQTIDNPRAYARRICYHEGVNMVREFDDCLPLQLSEDGELLQGHLVGRGEEKNNPEAIFLEQESTDELIIILADAIATNHRSPCQQWATIARLKEIWDDFPRLAVALKSRNIDYEVTYPEDASERQKLQSSYAPARRKLAEKLAIDLTLYK